MTSYSIPSGYITVASDTVIETPSTLNAYLGRSWESMRQMLEQLGVEISPIVNTTHSDWVRHKGLLYELHWSSDRSYLKRISIHRDGRITDISYNSLPPLIRGALE